MSTVDIAVPVMVQNLKISGALQYHIRPLFFSSPTVVGKRYENAVQKFRKEVRRFFKGFKLSRDNANQLLWYQFNPKIKHHVFDLDFSMGKQYIRGKFNVSYFKLQEQHFLCFPNFSSFICTMNEKEDGKPNKRTIRAKAIQIIEKLVRSYKKGAGVDTWPMDDHYATKGNFVTTVSFSVNVDSGGFGFENQGTDWMYAFFAGMQDFTGSVEIERVGYNLNELYPSELKRAFHREKAIQQLNDIIYQVDNTPIVLLGEEGVGKHSTIHEVVYRYCKQRREKESEQVDYYKFWHIDPTRVIAGMSIVGMWQKRFEAILKYVRTRIKKEGKKISGNDKILIDNPVALLRIGKSAQNSMTLSDVLKSHLEKRTIQVTIIATPEEWKIVQEKDRRFADLFQVIRLQEPNTRQAVSMILEQRKLLELENECRISIPAIRELFTIQRNYFKRKALPGSVSKLLTQLAIKFKMQNIDVEQVQNEFQEYSGLNLEIFDTTYTFEKNEVHKNIAASLIGQPKAVDCLADVIHRVKAKLNSPNKPLGSFLFIGPTGVGKTEAAKIVCRYLLGDEDKLMRFDMNEYIDESALARLIGDYYNPEGQLTGKIRYNPFGVLLFDEIEKAHPKVHDLLLQVLDDGRLTDSLGRTVDFANTIIIMTSNVGAQKASSQLGFKTENQNDDAIYQKAVENFFRPEFVNRIGKIVIFNALGLDHILEIAKLQIKNLLSRDGFVRRTTILSIAPEALEWVAQRGFNSKMGGRALKRQIERDLTVFTAEQLVQTKVDSPIIFDIYLEDNKLVPRIEILDFVEPLTDAWMPQVPDEQNPKKFYGDLLDAVEDLEDYVLDIEDARREEEGNEAGYFIDTSTYGNQNWQYYDFKNRIAEKKEKLQRLLMGFRNRYMENIQSNALRLKNAATNSILYVSRRYTKRKHSIEKILMKDRLFQKSALDELKYVYQNAPEQFDKNQSAYLNDLLDIAFMRLYAKGIEKGSVDKIEIEIRSTIENLGKEETNYLKELYEQVLKMLEVEYKIKDNIILAEGYSLHAILNSENGFHLFYRSHQNPLPMRVYVRWQDKALQPPTPPSLSVIRLYDVWLGENSKASTITDLRTGYTNHANITASEFKLFLYAGLDETNRLNPIEEEQEDEDEIEDVVNEEQDEFIDD